MKAKIIILPKKAHLGYTGVSAVHVGKYIEVDLAPGTDRTVAQRALDDACHKFLSNPIIEDYNLEIE
jgi:phosphoribosylformylglycinamidine synthase PurS subunit